jgi:uncharacterized protein YjiS (DUF1127 family)
MATKTYANGGNMPFAPASGIAGGTGIVALIASTILKWQERASMRHHLADLDKQYLTDMGLSANEVSSETSKSFWQS